MKAPLVCGRNDAVVPLLDLESVADREGPVATHLPTTEHRKGQVLPYASALDGRSCTLEHQSDPASSLSIT